MDVLEGYISSTRALDLDCLWWTVIISENLALGGNIMMRFIKRPPKIPSMNLKKAYPPVIY